MDPVGPWSAYASYSRLPGVQPSTSSGELHHHLPTTAAPATTTAQLIPGGFLSPPHVSYETVFSPLFHHAGAKPHYVAQHRAQGAKAGEGEYHQGQAFFEQGAWQQNSPFGILPHESVVATTTAKTGTYENFNFPLNHLNSGIAGAKGGTTRAQSPQVTTSTKSTVSQSNTTFFQVPSTFTSTDTSNTNKSFSTSNTTNIQQSCIVTSPSNPSVSKEYRGPAPSRNTTFLTTPTPNRTITTPQNKQQQQQIQTKAQTKIYPELNQKNSEDAQTRSSPVSYSILEAPGRVNTYSTGNAKRGQFQNYRHFQQGANQEGEFQRPKSNEYGATNGPDCNVVVPRRPSPLQAHSQASPIGHAPSPAYPMYNSPMNSISSPQQSNQVTPPLDASVPRPSSQTGSVAYPSVITRALNTDKNFECYDRPMQNRWEDRQAPRKFQNQQGSYPSNSTEGGQRAALVQMGGDRQGYFEAGHQVTLQDLSSCRGDPMSLVKNLQQQQSCQVQTAEIKQEKVPVKRRKSGEKTGGGNEPPVAASPMEYISPRIPPPAHTSAVNQQQQNGTYFDFDRWSLPAPAASKMFPSQAVHQQQLMVPHPHTHHAPPPLPYFPPFHLPPHPPEFAGGVELAPMGGAYGGGEQAQQQPGQYQQQQPQQEDNQPKVVVPNIEEELNFLSEGTPRPAATTAAPHHVKLPPTVPPIAKPPDKPSGPGVGFMSSYLKFLQGERDSSPPPPARGARKQNWARSVRPVQPVQEVKTTETNGTAVEKPVIVPPAPVTRLTTQGDPQDDPRYFPLPKERKRRSFDSSDDGISSDDDLFNRKVIAASTKERKDKGRKPRQPKNTEPKERKKTKKAEKQQQEERKKNHEAEINNIPRRETSRRAAKEKIGVKLVDKAAEDDIEEPPEFADSDSDPAWTPQAKNDGEEEIVDKRKRRGRPPGSKRKTKNLLTPTHSAGNNKETESISNGNTDTKKRKSGANKQKAAIPPTLEDNIAAAVAQQNNTPTPANTEDTGLFKPGEFVAIRTELNQEWPAIWRVDGKSLLQKYEPFEQDGQMLYRNISTYTSWTPESKKQYITVPVRHKGQGHLETVVEFLRNEVMVIDQDVFDRAIKDCERYQDNFEVYIQTLISQALDSNFLMEIFQEKDEYFLSNVKTIDDITDSKRQKLLLLLRWPQNVQVAVCTWPCFNVMKELNVADVQSKKCAACHQLGVSARVLLYGQPYNSTTLEGCPPDPQAVNEKDFLMCRMCAGRIELLNKVTHQKYLMYIECAKRVAEKRTAESQKDTTCILNELLADENWLNQLFLDVRGSWAEVDCLEHSYRARNAKVQ